jgi:hypothetical protein
MQTVAIDLLEDLPHPKELYEDPLLSQSFAELRSTALAILGNYGFSSADVNAISLRVTPVPWDVDGNTFHTRATIQSLAGRSYDSGWLDSIGSPRQD